MQCDMCGATDDNLYKAFIEGVDMNVCKSCSKFGKVVSQVRKPVENVKEAQKPIVIQREEIVQIFIEGYSELIRKGREKRGLTQKELAKKLNEKESLIQLVESGKLEPRISTGRKIERFLKVKLIEEHKEEKPLLESGKNNEELTLGDFIKVRKK